MDFISPIANWIVENEGLLSGLAAMIVVGGVILSPFGSSIRTLFGRQRPSNDEIQGNPSNVAEPTAVASARLPERNRQRPSIAILPLNNMSGDASQEYLADGLTEDLITLVSRVVGFDVIARNSTFAYKGQHPDIREVGERLGASYVVEGSLRQMGNSLRVTVQLIDAENGNHIWAEKYDRPLEEFFDLQDEVVASIAAQLVPQLDTAAIARHLDHSSDTLKAWALTRRAYTILRSERNNRENLERAIDLSEQALAIDPNYADAYGTMARAHSISYYFGETEDKENSKIRAEQAIATLRRLAPNDAVTYHAIGQFALATEGSEKAVPPLEEAVKRNPSDVLVLATLGYHLVQIGRVEEGLSMLQRALDLSPHDPGRHRLHFLMAMASVSQENYDRAYEHARASVELFDQFPAALALYAALLFARGEKEASKQQLTRLRIVNPNMKRDTILQRMGDSFGLKIEQEQIFNQLLDEAGFIDEPTTVT